MVLIGALNGKFQHSKSNAWKITVKTEKLCTLKGIRHQDPVLIIEKQKKHKQKSKGTAWEHATGEEATSTNSH